jgi:hypothetical protein
MKRWINISPVIMMLFLVTSCATAVRTPETVEQTTTMGVFTEVAGGSAEVGKVDLVIRLSLKTHAENYYLLESKKSLHGKPGYPFIVTVDGQSVVWRVNGGIEKIPLYDARGIRTPEGGDGMRYVLEKRLRLMTGVHRVEIDLPEERYSRGVDVTLDERTDPYLLEFKPIYRRSVTFRRPTFFQGLVELEPFLNGKPL